MNVPAGQHLCVCSKCRLRRWYDSNHREYRGQLWKTAETVIKHQELDEVRKQQFVERNESGVAAAIIREVAGGSVHPSTSLPVRPRDHADWTQETPVQRTQGNREVSMSRRCFSMSLINPMYVEYLYVRDRSRLGHRRCRS